MNNKLTQVFAELLARNRAAGGRRDYYGLRIDAISLDGSEFDLILVFKSCESSCCAEPGCHLAYGDPDWWQTLRGVMDEHGVGDLRPLTLRRVKGIVERGTRLRCRASLGLTEESAGYSYENGPHTEIADQKP